ncbi:MAG: cyclic nucleotide-binding domain-containing protein [Rubrobacteraceae bacterium]|nr:cyclic nucleotide-binding domain-containing protein [Rubrobacteraceae bacterium]MCL6437706.1 cyclic nucleotide-binding domain-containing protein [Rubrobacteraceae bacterium]
MREAPHPLEELDLFGGLDPAELEQIRRIARQIEFGPGATLIREGEPCRALYVLASGTVEVRKKILPGSTRQLAVLKAPTVVGEVGLLAGGARSTALVRARTRTRGYEIPREAFVGLVEEGSLAALKVVYELGRLLAERMAKTDDTIAQLVTRLEEGGDIQGPEIFRDTLIQEWET